MRRPTSLDAFVFGFVAPLHKASLPSSPLQSHLRQLENITRFCDNVLALYFSSNHPCKRLLESFNCREHPTIEEKKALTLLPVFPLLTFFVIACLLFSSAFITKHSSAIVSSGCHLSAGPPAPVQESMDANLQKLTQLVNKESNLIEKVLSAFRFALNSFAFVQVLMHYRYMWYPSIQIALMLYFCVCLAVPALTQKSFPADG